MAEVTIPDPAGILEVPEYHQAKLQAVEADHNKAMGLVLGDAFDPVTLELHVRPDNIRQSAIEVMMATNRNVMRQLLNTKAIVEQIATDDPGEAQNLGIFRIAHQADTLHMGWYLTGQTSGYTVNSYRAGFDAEILSRAMKRESVEHGVRDIRSYGSQFGRAAMQLAYNPVVFAEAADLQQQDAHDLFVINGYDYPTLIKIFELAE